MREVLISSAFLFALRQSAGGTPAIRWSVVRFKNDPQITQIRKIIRRITTVSAKRQIFAFRWLQAVVDATSSANSLKLVVRVIDHCVLVDVCI
ncbi:MAG: hypothetical protein LBP59_07400 [Planctomycetaceae bacterium]|nr:hypothetical protein [Planctomycetaceae bacterium]